MSNTAIVLLAIGKRGYGNAAHNLAISLKYFGNTLPIYLYADPYTIENIDRSLFTQVIEVSPTYYTFNDRYAPAYAKLRVFSEMPADEVLYIDVDSMALQPIEPLVEHLRATGKDFMTIYMGEGKKGDNISYDPWAVHDYAWKFFDIDEDATWTTVQSSLAWFKNTEQNRMYLRALTYFYEKGYSRTGLKEAWGKGFIPDELILSGVISKYNIDIKMGVEPVFFGGRNNPDIKLTISEIAKKYYFLSMYGGDGSKRIVLKRYEDYYTFEGIKMGRAIGHEFYNSKHIMCDKLLSQ